MKSADVIVIGAGIIGLCAAWQLARRSDLKIAVLERGAGVGEGSTGASSAVCRFRYTLDDMVFLARDGIEAYRHWDAFTGIAQPDAGFNRDGVLWLPGDDTLWATREHQRMQRLGIRTEVLDDAELQRRFPAFSTCTVAPDTERAQQHDCIGGGSHFFETDGGYIDPVACAGDLVRACRRQAVEVLFNSPVAGIAAAGGRVSGVSLADGSRLTAPVVVNAAGPWCNAFLQDPQLQLPWSLTPTRIQIVHLDRPPELVGHIPVTVDIAAGIYFRQQNRGQQIVLGSTLEQDEQERVPDPDTFNRFPDDVFMQAKLHALHHRLPNLPYRGKVRGYCGLYTVNEQDMHPVVGPTAVEGFYVANGFSGHGFKLAPAVGSLLARMIAGDARDFDTGVSTDLFSVDRQPICLPSKSVLA